MNTPAHLKYAASHEWSRLEADGTITVGITDHAQEALGDIVFLGYLGEGATLAGIGVVEGAGIELDAFTEHLDEAEPVVIHRLFHHGQHMVGVGGRGASHKGRPGADRLFDRVDGPILGTPHIGLRFESDGRGRRGLVCVGRRGADSSTGF